MTVGHERDVSDASEAGMRRRAFEVLDAAYRLGIRHVDTARSYGLGEQFLSEWLSERSPSGVFVSSKWGYRYTAGFQRRADVHEVKDHRLEHFESQWVESRSLLGKRLGLYQIHSLTLESPAVTNVALLARLQRIRSETGVAIGASVTGPRQGEVIDRLIELRVDGERVFGWVQATWNVLERSASEALARAKSAGLQVIVKEAMANGRLSPRGDATAVQQEAARLGVSSDVLSLAVALAQPFIDVVLSGAATVEQLESNVKARALTVEPELLTKCTVPPAQYWEERSRLSWT